MRRSRARSARPRRTTLLRGDCFLVRFSLTAVTLSGRYASNDLTALVSPIGVHHSERDALSHTQGDDAALTDLLLHEDRNGGEALVIPAEYLEVVVSR